VGPTCDAGTAGRRGVSVLALRRMAVWAMCFMRPPCCLTKNVLIHGGISGLLLRLEEEEKGGCVSHHVVPPTGGWMGVFILVGS